MIGSREGFIYRYEVEPTSLWDLSKNTTNTDIEFDGIVNEVVFLGSSIKYKVAIQNDKVLNVSKTSENFDKEIKKESKE